MKNGDSVGKATNRNIFTAFKSLTRNIISALSLSLSISPSFSLSVPPSIPFYVMLMFIQTNSTLKLKQGLVFRIFRLLWCVFLPKCSQLCIHSHNCNRHVNLSCILMYVCLYLCLCTDNVTESGWNSILKFFM